MFDMLKDLFNAPAAVKKAQISEEELCELLNTNPEALKAFEKSYQRCTDKAGVSNNLFKINNRQMAELQKGIQTDVPAELHDIVEKIVDDLVSQTMVYSYDGKKQTILDYTHTLPDSEPVTLNEINALPKELRPD